MDAKFEDELRALLNDNPQAIVAKLEAWKPLMEKRVFDFEVIDFCWKYGCERHDAAIQLIIGHYAPQFDRGSVERFFEDANGFEGIWLLEMSLEYGYPLNWNDPNVVFFAPDVSPNFLNLCIENSPKELFVSLLLIENLDFPAFETLAPLYDPQSVLDDIMLWRQNSFVARWNGRVQHTLIPNEVNRLQDIMEERLALQQRETLMKNLSPHSTHTALRKL